MAFGFNGGLEQAARQNGAPGASFKSYQELKSSLHRDLLSKVDLEKLTSLQDVRARTQVQSVIYDLIAVSNIPLSAGEKDRLCREVLHEVFGLGPLEPLLRDASVSDILVNTFKNVYVERAGKLERLPTTFQDDKHLMRVIDRIVSGVGRRVDDS